MSWRIKVAIGEVSAEVEIPLSERTSISLDKDGAVGKTLEILEQLKDKVLKSSLEFEAGKAKSEMSNKNQKLNS